MGLDYRYWVPEHNQSHVSLISEEDPEYFLSEEDKSVVKNFIGRFTVRN